MDKKQVITMLEDISQEAFNMSMHRALQDNAGCYYRNRDGTYWVSPQSVMRATINKVMEHLDVDLEEEDFSPGREEEEEESNGM